MKMVMVMIQTIKVRLLNDINHTPSGRTVVNAYKAGEIIDVIAL